MSFSDFRLAPNQGGRPDLYELENRAVDPDGVEPDQALLALARARDRRVRVLPGSAEHIPLAGAGAGDQPVRVRVTE
jgi:hypothetical protein